MAKSEITNGHGILKWYWEVTRQLFPPLCWCCRIWLTDGKRYSEAYPFLCPECLDALPWIPSETFCFACGHRTMDSNTLCSACVDDKFHFDRLWGGFRYEDVIQEWVLQFKFGKKEHMALLLGQLLSLSVKECFDLWEVDAIIPIPLHHKRLYQRGFNQAHLLAYHTFSKSKLLQPLWLRRMRHTAPQVELSATKRVLNVQGAFQADSRVKGKRLLLVDDVMTTGATLDAAAQSLKNEGALSVDVIVLAQRVLSNVNTPNPKNFSGSIQL
ncbi:MAG: ComF family protein [SAR324 cluster bacterium]|nr:ComF family protein [SAR324 cluster bacterium]